MHSDVNEEFTFLIAAVIPTYNVVRWLPNFLASLEAQSTDAGMVQYVFVDDGSTDESGRLLDEWAESRSSYVSVIHQANGGAAAARNTGLSAVRAEWVTFPDPDDVLHPDYFQQATKFLRMHGHKSVDLLTAHLIYLDGDGEVLNDSHPLRGKFSKGTRIVDLAAEPMIQLSAASAFFRTAPIIEAHLEFDARIKPNFEDGHFIGNYLLRVDAPRVGILASAKYHYRRRTDNTSTIQTSYASRAKYDDVLRFGYLPLLEQASSRGALPRWLENTVLYDIFWYFKNERAMHSPSASAPRDVLPTFHELVGRILALISADAIKSFDVMRVEYAVRQALLTGYADTPYLSQEARLVAVDEDLHLTHITYWFSGDLPEERIVVDGLQTSPVHETIEDLEFYGRVLLRRRHVWVSRGHRMEIFAGGRRLHASTSETRLLSESFTNKQLNPLIMTQRNRIKSRFTMDADGPGRWLLDEARGELHQLRRRFSRASMYERGLAAQLRSKSIRRRFQDAWVFMDKIHAANDNAEHLYRYTRANRPDINAWFVLHRSSSDWARLEAEGFRLVAHGSREWTLLMMSAVHYASSHADLPVVRPLPVRRFGVQKFKFTFLQHGVINYDLSRWLNGKPFDVFVTTTPDEYRSIAGAGSYSFSDKETVLTGMPRHDALLAKHRAIPAAERDIVLILPTWRHYLLGDVDPHSGERMRSTQFGSSEYARQFSRLLTSDALIESVEKEGAQVVFMPHPNMRPYLDDFEIDPRVKIASFRDTNIQDMLARSRAVVTDYSSLGFEAAFLDVPLVYLQFDIDKFFDGSHIGRRGYFDYDRDGFGTVTQDADATVQALIELAENKFTQPNEFAARTAAAFPTRDGNSSARVLAAMAATRDPAHRRKSPRSLDANEPQSLLFQD